MSKPASPQQPEKRSSERAGAKAVRSASALRDNLKRRKAQQRARHAPKDGAAEGGAD